jgi:hypothetical protein
MAPIEITNKRGWIGIRMSILRHEERDGTLFIMAGGLHEGAAAGVMLAYPLQWESGMWPWAGFGVHKGVITVLNPERRFDSFARVLADAYGLPRPGGLGECTAVEAMEYESDPSRALEARVELRLYFRAPDGDAVAEGVVYLVVDLKAGVLELNEREPESGKAILGQLARPA